MDAFTFRELKNNPEQFFNLLPENWQVEIVPFWKTHKNSAKIYIIENHCTIIGGGIVFSKSPPQFEYFETEAKPYFDEGYLYLGFIWIAEHQRNKNLGTFWLNQLKSENPRQNYFLLTEEDYLQHFYEKNGFSRIKLVQNQDHMEWLYISKPDKG
ncbi:GNAT family N-acetyltransferase [Gelidibacter mesophilus]|uniref:GNAT family N-acetyltransferase n=1 Tax=Gelidibacter mesophilus TaxID=169050 RepID=UPI0003FF6F11|nr:GNAT family N-acetyltransferase [Gelidibacter mesophilus]